MLQSVVPFMYWESEHLNSFSCVFCRNIENTLSSNLTVKHIFPGEIVTIQVNSYLRLEMHLILSWQKPNAISISAFAAS